MADSGCLLDEQSILVISKVHELEKIVYDNAGTPDGWGAAKLQLDIAKPYARLGSNAEAIEHLNIGAAAALSRIGACQKDFSQALFFQMQPI